MIEDVLRGDNGEENIEQLTLPGLEAPTSMERLLTAQERETLRQEREREIRAFEALRAAWRAGLVHSRLTA
jgi:hypothetical protein